MPQRRATRVKTDRRDARPRARLMRAGALPPVEVPAVDDAAIRALRRAREETRRDRKAATRRRTAFVRRHASRSTGRATWSPAPLRWLREVRCPTPAPQMVLQADVQTVTAQTARFHRLEHALHAQGHTWRCAPGVEALQALRGVQCTVAVTTVAARGDLTRFDHPQTTHARSRAHPRGIGAWGTSSPGWHDQDWEDACASCPRRRRLGVPVSGHGQSSPPTAPGKAPRRDPGDPRARPGPALHTVSPPEGHRQPCPSGRGRHGPGMAGLAVGHGQARGCETSGRKTAAGGSQSSPACFRLSAEAPPRCGGTLGGVRRPQGTLVPRMRQAPDGDTGRWEPTHG